MCFSEKGCFKIGKGHLENNVGDLCQSIIVGTHNMVYVESF